MASLTIRKLDEGIKDRLRQRAARHGCSMEQEVRDILRRAVQPAAADTGFTERIRRRFAHPEAEEPHGPEPRHKGAA